MEKIKFVQVGCGGFGSFLLEALYSSKEGKLVGIFDKNKQKGREIAKKFHLSLFNSLEEILQIPEIQCLVIATPHFCHFPQVRASLLAGKHVFCEKPLGLNQKEVETLLSLAEKKGLKLTVDFPLRASPIFNLSRKILQRQILGPLHFVLFENWAGERKKQTSWYHNKRQSGGWFLTSEIHFFDLLNWYLGFPQKIDAWEKKDNEGKTIETLSHLFFPSQTQSLVYHHLDSPRGETLSYFIFNEGLLLIQGWVPFQAKLFARKSLPEGLLVKEKNWQIRKKSANICHFRCLLEEKKEYQRLVRTLFDQFLQSIKKGKRENLLPSPEEIKEGEKIALLAQKSADLNQSLFYKFPKRGKVSF